MSGGKHSLQEPFFRAKSRKGAMGAFCTDCGAVFTDVIPWDFSKSKWLHENGTGHVVIYFAHNPNTSKP